MVQYQFPKNFVFIVVNRNFTTIDWGDGSGPQVITNPTSHIYHKYTTNSFYYVTFTSLNSIPYKLFTSPLLSNGYRYIINCPNTVKLNYSFSEQETSSNRINKLKKQTIYSNFKLTNPLIDTILPTKYNDYESAQNLIYGQVFCQNKGFDNQVLFGGGGGNSCDIGNITIGATNGGGGGGIITIETPLNTTLSDISTTIVLDGTTYYTQLYTETT